VSSICQEVESECKLNCTTFYGDSQYESHTSVGISAYLISKSKCSQTLNDTFCNHNVVCTFDIYIYNNNLMRYLLNTLCVIYNLTCPSFADETPF